MPRTRTVPKPSQSSAGKARKPSLKIQGWRTTDEEEIERRRQRAATEPLTVEVTEPAHPIFGTFRVASETGGAYGVEIRSLSRHDNSCGCPDYQVNGLGTCKHVEAVLLRHRGIRRESERIEVFLHRSGERPEVRAQCPAGTRRSAALALVERFFTPDGSLRGNPLNRLPGLARALTAAPARIRGAIRLSRYLLPWVEDESRRAARTAARERFLAEVEAGREALDVVKVPLYPYPCRSERACARAQARNGEVRLAGRSPEGARNCASACGQAARNRGKP